MEESNTPKVSIIIPCYNSEATLEETLNSVFSQDYSNWEAILVNDGSPDNLESIALKWVEKDARFKYYKKENGGLASARNYGVRKAKGLFILPLDSDNTINTSYLNKTLNVFQKNINIDIVYTDAEYFGEKQGLWKVGRFEPEKLLMRNYIDACAIYKKSVWECVEGYDENMPYQGNEDWVFWLSCSIKGKSFYYLEEPYFYYRVSSSSMIHSFDKSMFQRNRDYVTTKFANEYFIQFKKYKYHYDFYEEHPFRALYRYFKMLFK